MSTIAEFVTRLKDLNMSSGLRSIGATAQSAFSAAERSVSRFSGRLRQPVTSIDSLNRKLDDLRRTRNLSIDTREIRRVNREIQETERRLERMQNMGTRGGGPSSSGDGLLGAIGGIGLRGAVVGGVLAGGAALAAGTGKSISLGMQGGAQKTSFEVMAGAKDGNKLYGDLTKFANDSIFGAEMYQNAQTMLSFGAAAKEVMPDLKMLGDISMGNKEKLASLTLAFSQTRAAGKATGQDILQMINAGFNPLQIISQKTGKSIGVLKEQMEKGKISFSMIKQAFQDATGPGGRFFDMTNRIAQTPFGKWEAFKGQLEGIGLQLGTALMPVVGQVIGGLAGMADHLPAIISSMQPFFQFLSDLPVGELVSSALTEFGKMGTALMPVFNELKPIVVTIFQVVTPLISKFRELATTTLQKLSPSLTNIVHIIGRVLNPALQIAGVLISKAIDVLGWAIDKVAKLLNFVTRIVSFVADGVGWVMDKTAAVVTSKTNAITETLKKGVSDTKVVSFFKKVGEMHGQSYVDGIVSQYGRIAVFMDKLYNTTTWTTRFKQIKDKLYGTKVSPATATVTGTDTGKGTGTGTGAGDLGDKIAKGGPQQIIFKMEALSKPTFYVSQAVEAVQALEADAAEALLRALNSLGYGR